MRFQKKTVLVFVAIADKINDIFASSKGNGNNFQVSGFISRGGRSFLLKRLNYVAQEMTTNEMNYDDKEKTNYYLDTSTSLIIVTLI